MLVLSRRRGERIMIGADIELTVVGIVGDKVRLGFQAPPHVAINRQEVHDRIQDEIREGTQTDGNTIAGCR